MSSSKLESDTDSSQSQSDDNTWASRGQASAHQLRRLSTQPAHASPAAEDGDRSIKRAVKASGYLTAFEEEGETPATRRGGLASLRAVHSPSQKHRPSPGQTGAAVRPDFASTTTAPSLRTLNDGFASLERHLHSARAPENLSPLATGRLSSAPALRQPGGMSPPSPPAAATAGARARLEPLHVAPVSARPTAPTFSSSSGAAPLLSLPIPTPQEETRTVTGGHPMTSTSSPVSSPAVLTGGAETPVEGRPRSTTPPPHSTANATDSGSVDTSCTRRLPSGNGSRPSRRSRLAPTAEDTAAVQMDSQAEAPSQPTPSGTSARKASPQQPQRQTSDLSAVSVTAGAAGGGKGRDGRIKVVVRKRPFNAGESGTDCVAVRRPNLTLSMTKQRVDLTEYTESSEFAFDDAFNETASNEEVYAACVPDLLKVALLGGSASVFAYGQTGSGKTFTMMGESPTAAADKGTAEKGLYLLGATELFRRLSPTQTLLVSFYEIYCNSLFDLLNSRAPVVLREDGNRRVNICGLSWHPIVSPEELWAIVQSGFDQRRTGSTSANERSSRSHAIMSVRVKDEADADFEGTLNFVDLAGSERGADTANNDRLTRLEGAEINKSLLALKECIRSLDEKKRHVPFRGSRLTEVLRDSFTGNSKTVMIANVSPSSLNYEHTANTLRYAFRVKGLSVASVAPSKARNAPRPYQAEAAAGARGGRARQSVSPPTSRLVARGAESEDQKGSPARPRAKQRRNSKSRERRSRSNAIERRSRQSRSPSDIQRTAEGSKVLTSKVDEDASVDRSRLVEAGGTAHNPFLHHHPLSTPTDAGARGSFFGDANAKAANSYLNGKAREQREVSVISLLTDEPSAAEPRTAVSSGLTSPLPEISRLSRPPAASSNMATPPRAPRRVLSQRGGGGSPDQVSTGDEEPVLMTQTELQTMESRMKARIMQQLRHDLGKDIQRTLDERDSLIARLQAENAALRETVRRLERNCAAPLPPTSLGWTSGVDSDGNEESGDAREIIMTRKPDQPAAPWLEL